MRCSHINCIFGHHCQDISRSSSLFAHSLISPMGKASNKLKNLLSHYTYIVESQTIMSVIGSKLTSFHAGQSYIHTHVPSYISQYSTVDIGKMSPRLAPITLSALQTPNYHTHNQSAPHLTMLKPKSEKGIIYYNSTVKL